MRESLLRTSAILLSLSFTACPASRNASELRTFFDGEHLSTWWRGRGDSRG